MRVVYNEDSAARLTILITKLGNDDSKTSRIVMSYLVSDMSGHGLMTSQPEL